MLKKYIFHSLVQAYNHTHHVVKQKNKLQFRDWLYLDGADVPWEKQTYSKPQLDTQPIGWEHVQLTGRSYQLKWLSRGRNRNRYSNSNRNRNSAAKECKSSSQKDVQTCKDAPLLKQGIAALEEDYAFFGLLDRYHESMCLLHAINRLPWPEEDAKACAQNLRRACLRNVTCAPKAVCPSLQANQNVHEYQGKAREDTEQLVGLVEKPELALLDWAQQTFQTRYEKMGKTVKCELSTPTLIRQANWLGEGCFGIGKTTIGPIGHIGPIGQIGHSSKH